MYTTVHYPRKRPTPATVGAAGAADRPNQSSRGADVPLDALAGPHPAQRLAELLKRQRLAQQQPRVDRPAGHQLDGRGPARELMTSGAVDPRLLLSKPLPLEEFGEALRRVRAGQGIKWHIRPS